MKLKIEDNKKLSEVKQEFNQLFPYLKIEFFTHPHREGEGSPKKDIISDSKTFAQCDALHNGGGLEINSGMAVADVEKAFSDHYGLSAQVFRKSGKVWLETTLTDSWTLEHQNQHGEAISKAYD